MELLEKIKLIPNQPGCYMYFNSDNTIIYVGKAKNLKKRVSQYFNKTAKDFKTTKLVNEIKDVKYIIVNNENEALILENDLIKKYQPKYNILLRESSGYPYIVLTKEKHPKLIYTRNNTKINGNYFGPFADTKFDKNDLFKLVQKLFPLRKCNVLPKRKCIYYDINQCLGPCINKINDSDYEPITKAIKDFFHGKTNDVIKTLKAKEEKYSANLEFEKANEAFKLINSLKLLKQKQNIKFDDKNNIDIIGYYYDEQNICINIFRYNNGQLLAKYNQTFSYLYSHEETFIDFINKYYQEEKTKINKLYLPSDTKKLEDLRLNDNIKVVLPQKGKFATLIELANKNAKDYYLNNYLHFIKTKVIDDEGYSQLKAILKNTKLNNIKVFDASNFFNENFIVGMIGVENGKFNKNNYRKFNIKNISKQSDYDSIYEAVYRHFKNEPQADLIIVDGGINQVNAAKKALNELNLDIMVIGLTKDNNHHTDSITFTNGENLLLDRKTPLYLYLSNIQEEVHRFAISFFKKKQRKGLINGK